MSLKETDSTSYYNSIPSKCKSCSKAIFTVEGSEIYYQCSLYGKFKRSCKVKTSERQLKKPHEILQQHREVI